MTDGVHLPAGLSADWSLPRDLACPVCRYNLRMLRNPRCPECGTEFRWQQLLAVSCPRCDLGLMDVDGDACPQCALPLRWELLLSEAAPRVETRFEMSDRPFRAALGTCLAAIRPVAFWRKVYIEIAPAAVRLRRFRIAMLVVGVLGWIAPIVAGMIAPWGWGGWMTAGIVVFGPPLITAALLPRFTLTFAKFRIRADRLRRVFVYGLIGVFWSGILWGTLAITTLLLTRFVGASRRGARFPLLWNEYPLSLLYEIQDIVRVARWDRYPYTSEWAYWWNYLVRNAVDINALVLVFAILIAWLWWPVFLYGGLRVYLKLTKYSAVMLTLSTQLIIALIVAFGLLAVWITTNDGLMLLGW